MIAPRVIQSQMLDSLYPTDESKRTIIDEIPIGRLGKTSDISKLVHYVSSKEANFIQGQILVLYGGRTCQMK